MSQVSSGGREKAAAGEARAGGWHRSMVSRAQVPPSAPRLGRRARGRVWTPRQCSERDQGCAAGGHDAKATQPGQRAHGGGLARVALIACPHARKARPSPAKDTATPTAKPPLDCRPLHAHVPRSRAARASTVSLAAGAGLPGPAGAPRRGGGGLLGCRPPGTRHGEPRRGSQARAGRSGGRRPAVPAASSAARPAAAARARPPPAQGRRACARLPSPRRGCPVPALSLPCAHRQRTRDYVCVLQLPPPRHQHACHHTVAPTLAYVPRPPARRSRLRTMPAPAMASRRLA